MEINIYLKHNLKYYHHIPTQLGVSIRTYCAFLFTHLMHIIYREPIFMKSSKLNFQTCWLKDLEKHRWENPFLLNLHVSSLQLFYTMSSSICILKVEFRCRTAIAENLLVGASVYRFNPWILLCEDLTMLPILIIHRLHTAISFASLVNDLNCRSTYSKLL